MPYIGFMFVDELYRGNRLSQQLICYAMDYLKNVGFDKVYIVSDHVNLYEKYGFVIIDRKIAPWGSEEKYICRNFEFQFGAMLKLFDKVPKPFGRLRQYGFL